MYSLAARSRLSLQRVVSAGASSASRASACDVSTVITLPWAGRVLRWEAKEGQAVKAGQTLVRARAALVGGMRLGRSRRAASAPRLPGSRC